MAFGMMKRFLTFTIGIFHLLVGITAFAQQTLNYASLGGLVVDSTEEAVAGAFVSAWQIETNQTNTAATESNGRFRFPYLKPGSYEITVRQRRRCRFERSILRLRCRQPVSGGH